MSTTIKTGNQGENMAADFLEASGYKILERNYRHKRSEIDLIATKDNLLVFVEVKARSSRAFGEPEAFVNDRKAEKIFEAAEHYMLETNWRGNIRFDIVSVVFMKEPEIVHFEDAFH